MHAHISKHNTIAALACVFSLGGSFFGFCSPAAAQAQGSASAVPDRAREEASRPLRWIIESAKIERKKPSPPPPAAPEPVARRKPVAPVATPVATHAVSPATAPMPVARGNEPGGRAVPAEAVAPATATAAVPARQETAAAAATMPPAAATPSTASVAAPVATPVAHPAAAPVAAAAPRTQARYEPEPDALVPISQSAPEIWAGFCPEGCDKYLFRVAFKVLPSGQVDDVKIVASNNPKLNRAVLKAVSEWRYQPVRTAREEEVSLRPARP